MFGTEFDLNDGRGLVLPYLHAMVVKIVGSFTHAYTRTSYKVTIPQALVIHDLP